MLPIRTTDYDVFHHARTQGMILISCNRDDFLAFAAEIPHPGIIILIRRATRLRESSRLLRLIATAGERGLQNNLNFA